jgi:hypothetical protein
MSNAWHPEESQLLGYADSELERGEAGKMQSHLDECFACRARIEEFRRFWPIYREIVRAPLPPPPCEWTDLRSRLRDLDAGGGVSEMDAARVQSRSRQRFRPDLRWVAAAAALVIGAVAIQITGGRTLNAAELLRDASAAERTRPRTMAPSKRIRVKTRKTQFVRPAIVMPGAETGDEAGVAHLFREARYNWDDPLSPLSFSNWRNGLKQKDDRVNVVRDAEWGHGRFYHITTSTVDGTLAEATITIRAEDLQAVQQTFQFRGDEYVEISEAAAEPPVAPENEIAPRAVTVPPAPVKRRVTPSDELRVIVAVHAIGADLGDPVEITRDDEEQRIIVKVLAVGSERGKQVRTALADMPFVDLRVELPEALRTPSSSIIERRTPAGAPKLNRIQERLAARLGGSATAENFTNHVMDLSEAALARAHALRSLAERFPATTESQFSETDRAMLQRIQEDHIRALLGSVRQMNDVLRPVANAEAGAPVPDFTSWQKGAEDVLEAAAQVDRTLTNALAGSGPSGDPDEALLMAGRAARDLQARAAALQTTVARSGTTK